MHKLLPSLTLDHCLYVLNEAFTKLNLTLIDETVKILFGLTKLYCARRFTTLLAKYPEVVKSLDKTLLKLLVAKALYFITDEHNIQSFMKVSTVLIYDTSKLIFV